MSNKVVLVGTGAVGSSYAYAVMNQGLCDELVLVDLNSEKVMGESMDLKHGMVYGPSPMTVKAGEYDDCMDASIVVLSAGAAQKPGETRLDLVKKNMQTYHSIVHNVMESGFNGIFLVATNPADILTYAVWKFSGLPRKQVIGSGTVLDSARFRTLLAAEFDVSPFSVHASIIGEHGDTQLPVWSAATIAGLPLSPKLSDERKEELGREVREAAYHIIQAKGATSYGIAMGLARITRAILTNERVVLPVGALLEGEYGHHQVCIGSPAVIMRSGVERIVELELTETEKKKLDHSVYTLQDIQSHYWN